MSPCKIIADVVLKRLQESTIPGIQSEEILVLPEGRVPASMGQRWITVSPTSVRTVTQDNFRPEVVGFQVVLVQRIRDTPNDRFGIIYGDPAEMHDIHNSIKNLIQSLAMLRELEVYLNAKENSPRTVNYSRQFNHLITILDPIHLYPGYFLSKPSSDSAKIAGFKTYSSFTSPRFYPIINPLGC